MISDDIDYEEVHFDTCVNVRDDGPAVTTLGAGNDPTTPDDDRAAIATEAVVDVGTTMIVLMLELRMMIVLKNSMMIAQLPM